MSTGTLFVISAPSGAGKTTIMKQVMESLPGISFSVSHTTRSPREGEQNEKDYHFISVETFRKMQNQNAFLEWAEVHNNFYGTSKSEIDYLLNDGTDIILDIDIQGARQVKAAESVSAVFIFILPPSLAELEKRLRGRGTDSDETINVRLTNSKKEMEEVDLYDHVIINDSVEEAAEMLRSVILAERSKNRRDASGKPLTVPA